jgi:hypothetical protein
VLKSFREVTQAYDDPGLDIIEAASGFWSPTQGWQDKKAEEEIREGQEPEVLLFQVLRSYHSTSYTPSSRTNRSNHG